MMRKYMKLSEEDQKIYDSRKLVMGLISPFGIMFLVFLVYSLAGGRGEQQSLAQGETQQVQRVVESP